MPPRFFVLGLVPPEPHCELRLCAAEDNLFELVKALKDAQAVDEGARGRLERLPREAVVRLRVDREGLSFL